MDISTTFARPTVINGFSARSPAEAALAERSIDPAKPGSGAFGANDPKLADKGYFSPAARDAEMLERKQAETARPVSPVAGAYAAAETPFDPPLLKLLA